jgi:hypothetical protein
MGVDFIRSQSGKPWRKRWDKGLNRLKVSSLFDVEFSEHQRTVTANIDCRSPVKVGQNVVVEFRGTSAIVCDGLQRIGDIPKVPADINEVISNCGGIALGTVERVGLFGNNAELSIR